MLGQRSAFCLVLIAVGACSPGSPDDVAYADAESGEAGLTGTVDDSGTIARDEWRQYGPFDVEDGGALRAVLTMTNGDADLYVRVGQTPTANSFDCRPYLGGSQTEACELDGPSTIYVAVSGYGLTTDFDLSITTTGATSALCGNATLDAGELCDGKPTACSNLDPAWKWGEAPCLDDCSGWDESACNLSHPEHFSDWGTISSGQWRHFGPFNASDGEFKAVLGGTDLGGIGDADLYVRRGLPATGGAFDCRSDGPESLESCTLQGGGLYYVSIFGYAPSSDYTVEVDYLFKYTTPEVRVNERAGNVTSGEWIYFGPYPHGSGLIQIVMSGTHDADLYVRHGSKPTEDAWDCRPYASGSDEFCDLGVVDGGQLWVGVQGYAATSYFEMMAVWVED